MRAVSDPRAASRPRVHLRQLAWFMLAIVVPSIVVVGLGLRMVVEQDELAQKHLQDERRLRVSDFERALIARLDAIRRNPDDAAVAMIAEPTDGRLVLPWERVQPPVVSARVREAVAAAARDEFGSAQLTSAEFRLRAALAESRTPSDLAFVRLPLARVLARQERQRDALNQYHALLMTGTGVLDDSGMPMALYAAERLAEQGDLSESELTAIAAHVETALARPLLLPPVGWYELRAITSRLIGEAAYRARFNDLATRLDHTVADVEHALALQRDAGSMLAHWNVSNTAWLPHGTPLWLVGLSAETSLRRPVVLAVSAASVATAAARAIGSPAISLVAASGDGEWLGDSFPGLKVKVDTGSAPPQTLQRAFYLTAVAIVLGLTLFGGYLLLRDVQRDLRLAELRAQFVSSVSHELKTPLTAIRMFAETLQSGRLDAPMRADYLETIVNESERLTRLLNNVLDFSRIEQGVKAYQRQRASLADIVRLAARTMTYPLAQQGFVIEVDADETLPPVDVDADALEQAILNLLTNAVKYSGESRRIELQLARDGADAVISVRDRGIGISPADQQHIFEKFYRAPGPAAERISGTGLGLTIVDHIVQAHGGRVTVESSPGHGSTFAVRLPIGCEGPVAAGVA